MTLLSDYIIATGTSPGLVPDYQAGTATVVVSGTKNTTPSLSIAYAKVGDMVTITMESKGAGWSTTKNNNGAFIVSGIVPSALRPAEIINFAFQQTHGKFKIGRALATT